MARSIILDLFGISNARGSQIELNETRSHTMCTWRNKIVGSQSMGKLCSGGKLDKCEVTLI